MLYKGVSFVRKWLIADDDFPGEVMSIDEKQTNDLRLYTRAEAAKALSISKSSLCSLISDGVIGIVTIKNQIYVPHVELVKFIQINTVKLQKEMDNEEVEIDLAKVRKQNISSSFNSVDLLKHIMEQDNGKYIY